MKILYTSVCQCGWKTSRLSRLRLVLDKVLHDTLGHHRIERSTFRWGTP